jgi:carboxylesterase type B
MPGLAWRGGRHGVREGAERADRALSVATLLEAVTPRVSTGPILDGKVVPMDITAAYRSGQDAGVPILLGWNSNEAARFIDHATLSGYAASARQSYGPLAPALLRLYPASTEAVATCAAQDLMSDAGFGWRSWSIAEARNRAGAAPVFLYRFDDPRRSWTARGSMAPSTPMNLASYGGTTIHTDAGRSPTRRWPTACRHIGRASCARATRTVPVCRIGMLTAGEGLRCGCAATA